MKRVITRVSVLFVLAFCLAFSGIAQTPDQPNNFLAAGFAFDGAHSNGWASFGKSIGAGLYSITTYDVSMASRAPLTFQYSGRTGIGYDMTHLVPQFSFGGRLHLIGLGDGGASASAEALGSAFSGGGLATWDFGEKARHLNIVAGGRLLKTSTGGTGTVIEIGIALPF
ncbi:MAG TPA: hypothetical protein VGM97_01960 [Steroidobacteraceae bacterium]|jgi:hypothetical protein